MSHPEATIHLRENIRSFHQSVSLLSDRTIEEQMSFGKTAVFDIADLGGDLSTRGVDGRLPRLTSNDNQVPVTLEEFGGKMEITNFEAFTSQSNERDKMNAKMMARTNRRLDKVLIDALDQSSVTYNGGAAIVMDPDNAGRLIAEFENAEIPVNPNDVTIVATANVRRQLMKHPQYTSSDYVSVKPHQSGDAAIYANERRIKAWNDVAWTYSPLLPGKGTPTASCYIFHRNAIGCAKPVSQIKYTTGFDEQDHYHFCSTSLPAAAKILQQGGVLKFIHDDSAA